MVKNNDVKNITKNTKITTDINNNISNNNNRKGKFRGMFVDFKSDLIAGLIVAIVALPLAIGFSIASGVSPVMGIYAAIIGGLFAALFGGSEYQISGPTGAMIVVILSVASKYGVDGLILATIIAGVILLLLWLFKMGKAIEYIPYPVIVGFTAGIAVLIFFGQINNFMGINPVYPIDSGFFTKTMISFSNYMYSNIYAIIIALATIVILISMKYISKKIPGSIVAVLFGLGAVYFFNSILHLKTVGDIGIIPNGVPMPHIPLVTWEMILFVLPGALTIAILAAIESLLSAVVADGMTGTKHDSNKELRGQGIANIASALFGGLPVTGAIARTATNIRNGGKSRFVGVIHALILLMILLLLGPIFSLIPLAVIAGILMFVAFNMVEWHLVFEIFKMPLSDVAVMIVTFALTVFVDLTVAIEVGIVLAALLFMKRMGDLYNIEEHSFDNPNENEFSKNVTQKLNHPDISIYTLNGPLFFGAAAKLDQEISNTPGRHKPIKIIRMKYVTVIDATGISALRAIIKHHRKVENGMVFLSTIQPNVYSLMVKSGFINDIGKDNIFRKTSDAFEHALIYSHKMHNEPLKLTSDEIKKYDLKYIDADDSHLILVNDKDPVEDILKTTGIDKISRHTIDAGIKITETTKKYSKIHNDKVRLRRKELIESNPIKSRKLKRLKKIKF
ncbi:MAG: SulP family inorganic anion transporter [Candidatus Woesearchaeota archaeon]